MSSCHEDIPAIQCLVKEEFLYNMDESKVGGFVSCKLYAVSSYKDHFPTFKIILSDGSLFDYIPPHALFHLKASHAEPELSLDELCFAKVCPDFNISVNVYNELVKKPVVWSWFPQSKTWIKGAYHCSIDWFTSNQSCNLILLENGQLSFVPNHKMVVDETHPEVLTPYKKLRSEWIPKSNNSLP